MAGSGWKAWTRERLSAAQLQSYLQDQVVQHYTSRAARTATGPGAPSAGMVSWLEDEQALELYRNGAWHAVAQRIVGFFPMASASAQVATTTLTRVSGSMNGSCQLRAGRVYRAKWRAGFTTQTANQGAVAAITITNAASTPATTDTQVIGVGYITSVTDQPGMHHLEGLFQVATSKEYLFSPWLRRAAVAPATGYVQSITNTVGGTALQYLEITELGTVAEMAALMVQSPGAVPLITI